MLNTLADRDKNKNHPSKFSSGTTKLRWQEGWDTQLIFSMECSCRLLNGIPAVINSDGCLRLRNQSLSAGYLALQPLLSFPEYFDEVQIKALRCVCANGEEKSPNFTWHWLIYIFNVEIFTEFKDCYLKMYSCATPADVFIQMCDLIFNLHVENVTSKIRTKTTIHLN